MLTIEAVLFYLFLLDSIGANFVSWGNTKWYKKNYPWFAKRFPPSKGWTGMYLLLVLWVGYSLNRLGVI